MSDHCCTETTCSPEAPTADQCDMPEKMMALADEAWFELLKEKIKAEIQNTNGAHMDKIAKFITESNNAKWAHMIQGKVKCEEFKQNLKSLMVEGAMK